MNGTCYVDGQPCDCHDSDDCERDEYAHDDELISEEDIDELYEARLAMQEQV